MLKTVSYASGSRLFAPGGGLLASLLGGQPIHNVVLVDVADVGDRLLPYVFGGFQLDIAEPPVGVQPILPCLLSEAGNPGGPGVVAGKGEQRLFRGSRP